MKVALACNGEGFGHVSRTTAFYEALKDRYDLVILAPETVHGFLSDKLPQARVFSVPHMHLAKISDRINFLRTAWENMPTLLTLKTRILRTGRLLRELGVGVVINDYEPFSAIAAKRIGIPVLQFNHPGIVVQSPSIMPDALAVKFIARFMMPSYDKRIFCSFYNGDVGPMIRQELSDAAAAASPSPGDYYVVSLKESYRRPVLKRLHQMGIRNYRLFPNPDDHYPSAVANCRAVITSAGHQTLSECIHMGKPVFAIPQRGQYEQRLNARMLVASGWGSHGSIRNLKRTLPDFISRLDEYPRKAVPWVKFNFNNDTDRIIGKIEKFIRLSSRPAIVPIWNFLFPDDEGPADVHNLWGLLPVKSREMEDLRHQRLYRQFRPGDRHEQRTAAR